MAANPQPPGNRLSLAYPARSIRKADRLTQESRNAAQDDDEGEQAQSLADELLRRGYQTGESVRVRSRGFDEEGGSILDLVDHMKQMVRDGRIDMSAYRGERMDDDEEDGLGPQGRENDGPRGAQ